MQQAGTEDGYRCAYMEFEIASGEDEAELGEQTVEGAPGKGLDPLTGVDTRDAKDLGTKALECLE